MDAATIEAARQELQTTTKEQIEWGSAKMWCARAEVAYALYVETRELRWLLDANAYHGEAVEHAAHAGSVQLSIVEHVLNQAQRAAVGP